MFGNLSLQTETALSTMENEIMALSACRRELFPIIDMISSLAEATNFLIGNTTKKVFIYEDKFRNSCVG
jgi:hypothetical protein